MYIYMIYTKHLYHANAPTSIFSLPPTPPSVFSVEPGGATDAFGAPSRYAWDRSEPLTRSTIARSQSGTLFFFFILHIIQLADGLYTKGARAHTHSKLIREWLWSSRGAPLTTCRCLELKPQKRSAGRKNRPLFKQTGS